jgi:uncharacterized surface protein with fasciclin (FAS1) repeats
MPQPFTLSRLRPTLALAAALLVWTGCDSETNFETPPPPTGPPSIVQQVVGDDDLSTLESAVLAAGISGALSGEGPFTVFAPTNAAFDALLAELDATADELLARDDLAQILTLHAVSGAFPSSGLAVGDELTTLNGQTLTVVAAGDGLGLDTQDEGAEPNALITTTDIEASNGVLHKIDQVLLPAAVGFGPEEDVRPAFDRDGNEVGQISLTRLFAPVTDAEVDAALAAVSGRDQGVYDYQEVGSAPTPFGTLYVVSHTVRAAPAGGDFPTHYGAIHVPNDEDGDPAEDLPVLIYSHGGDSGVAAVEPFVLLGLLDGTTGQPTPDPDPNAVAFVRGVVTVIPTFRSEELRTAGLGLPQSTYTSTGNPSPWDYDVDDTAALLNVALEQFDDATDEDRIGTLGFSRGGAVSLLHAARDERVDVVTDFFGPTDFFEAQFQGLATVLLAGPDQPVVTGQPTYEQALSLPGADFILDALLLPLSEVGPFQPAYDLARQQIVLRSAAYYTERLPNLQVHHHYRDAVVPVTQSIALNAQVEAQPNTGAYDYNLYGAPGEVDQSFHNPAAFPESVPATLQFHFENLIGG